MFIVSRPGQNEKVRKPNERQTLTGNAHPGAVSLSLRRPRLLLPKPPKPAQHNSASDQETDNRPNCFNPRVRVQSETGEHNTTQQGKCTKEPGSEALDKGSLQLDMRIKHIYSRHRGNMLEQR